MSEFSNSELLISDDAVSRLLSGLEQDSDLEALRNKKEPISSRRMAPATSGHHGVSSIGYVQPKTSSVPVKRHTGRKIVFTVLAVAILSVSGFLMFDQMQGKEDIGSAADPIVKTEVSPVPSATPKLKTKPKIHEYTALFEYNAEEVADLSEYLGCSLSCDGKVLILENEENPDKLLPKLSIYLDEELKALVETPAHIDFTSAVANEDYSEITIVVTAVKLNVPEQEAVDRLLVPAAVYNNLSESGAASIRIVFNNMLGDTVRVIDSADF